MNVLQILVVGSSTRVFKFLWSHPLFLESNAVATDAIGKSGEMKFGSLILTFDGQDLFPVDGG